MRDYLERGVDYLGNLDRDRVGHLVNNTIGKHLPSLFKRFNYKHVSSLAEHEYGQMHFHISQVLNSDRSATASLFAWKTPGTFWTWNTSRPVTSARLPC